MSDETYSLSTDFGNELDNDELMKEVNADAGIGPTAEYVNTSGDVVVIHFDSALDAGEKTVLDGLVAVHEIVQIGVHSVNVIIIEDLRAVKTSTFKVMATFDYLHHVHHDITHVKITAKLMSGTTYEVRMVDLTDGEIIASGTFSNSDVAINDMGTISNLPDHDAVFEIQARGNSGSKACLRSVNVYYN